MQPLLRPVLARLAAHWAPLGAAQLGLITLLSLWPLAELPALPGSDKTHHLLAYAALVLPMGLAQPRGWGWLALLMLGWSGAIELLQPLVNRYAEWLDLAANGAGLLLGAALGSALRRLR